MTALGKFFKLVGWIVFSVAGLWGFFLCLVIIERVTGFWGLVTALLVAPATFVAAPLYAGFTWGNWFPFVLNYGGAIVAAILIGIGNAMSGK